MHEEGGVDQRVQSGLDQREERAKATHRAQLHADQLSDLEHDERWEGVRLYPGLPTPSDEGQELQKALKVDSLGKQHVQELRSTEEAGTSTVTYKRTKVGVTKTVQGSKEGAWLVDTTEHVASLATKADQARQERTARMYTDFESAQEDIKAGRRCGPMLATASLGHFSYWREVRKGSPESMAVPAHVGLLGQELPTKSH